MYSPNSELWLLTTPLVKDDENTIIFDSESEQAKWFQTRGNSYWQGDDFQHIRKDRCIRVNGNMEDFLQYNYLMFKNTHFSNKWFYAFIDDIRYLSEKVTEIYFTIDSIQTFYFDYITKKSYIERQHWKTDDWSTIPDSVASGKLIEKEHKTYYSDGVYVVFCSNTVADDDTTSSITYDFYIGMYNIPCMVLVFSDGDDFSKVMQNISNKGRADRIISAVYVPFLDIDDFRIDKVDSDVGTLPVAEGLTSFTKTITFESSYLQNMKYKKMSCSPYSEVRVTDITTGQFIQLDYSKFKSKIMEFELQVTFSNHPSYRLIPLDYCGQTYAYDNALVVNCNTMLPTINNTYANYLMKNGNINNLNKSFARSDASRANSILQTNANYDMLKGVGNLIGNAASGNIGGVINGALNQRQNQYNNQMQQVNNNVSAYEKIAMISAQEDSMSKQASQMTDMSDDAMQRICMSQGLKFSVFAPDDFNTYCIENFWKMYGYTNHALDDINHRVDYQNWCYTKVVSPNIEGEGIPNIYLADICNRYERGITWWRKDYFKNYN